MSTATNPIKTDLPHEWYHISSGYQLPSATVATQPYEAEMEHQVERVGELQEQVRQLKEAVKDLKPQFGRTGAQART